MKQYYSCDKCGVVRYVRYEEHSTMLAVLNNIKADHEEQSPDCAFSTDYIRVYGPNAKVPTTTT